MFTPSNPPNTKKLIFSGNSLFNFATNNTTYGFTCPIATYNGLSGKKASVFYFAIGGRNLTQLISEFTTSGLAGTISKDDVIVFNELTNSLISNPGAISTVYGQLIQYRDMVRALGGIFIMCTMMARNEAYAGTEADRVAINTVINAAPTGTFDAIVDLGGVAPWNNVANTTDTNIYNADKCHQTALGYTMMADSIRPVVQPYFI